MVSVLCCVLVVLLAIVPATLSGGGDGPFIFIDNLPRCASDEFVTFNGSQLACKTLPKRECNCPDVSPDLPDGCQTFNPPFRGGFVCLRTPNTVYCSVLCDNTSEFSGGIPFNPYQCGPKTGFLWRDITEKSYKSLPQCDGHRRRTSLFQDIFYFPVPCDQLTETQKQDLFMNLVSDLERMFGCTNCETTQAYIQCPPYSAAPTQSTYHPPVLPPTYPPSPYNHHH